MAVAAVTYTFAPLTDIKSSEANRNFQDLVAFINQNLIQKDASVAFTATPSGPALDPISDNQYARKAYVDKGPDVSQSSHTPGGVSNTTSASHVNWPITGGQYTLSHTKKQASSNILVMWFGGGYAVTSAGTGAEFAVRVDGAGTDFVLTEFNYSVIDTHLAHVGSVLIPGLSAAAHTYGLRARRLSGTGALRTDGNDRQQFVILEVS